MKGLNLRSEDDRKPKNNNTAVWFCKTVFEKWQCSTEKVRVNNNADNGILETYNNNMDKGDNAWLMRHIKFWKVHFFSFFINEGNSFYIYYNFDGMTCESAPR